MRLNRITLLLVVVLALAACGDDDAADTTDAPDQTQATTTTAGGSAGEPDVVIEGFAFAEVNDVAVGDEVLVVNRDGASHTWTSNDGVFDSGSMSGGSSFTFTFTEAGTYDFFCSIHPSMTGSITVTG